MIRAALARVLEWCLRPPEDPARPPVPDPPPAAGRAEQWARIDALIERTTGGA